MRFDGTAGIAWIVFSSLEGHYDEKVLFWWDESWRGERGGVGRHHSPGAPRRFIGQGPGTAMIAVIRCVDRYRPAADEGIHGEYTQDGLIMTHGAAKTAVQACIALYPACILACLLW